MQNAYLWESKVSDSKISTALQQIYALLVPQNKVHPVKTNIFNIKISEILFIIWYIYSYPSYKKMLMKILSWKVNGYGILKCLRDGTVQKCISEMYYLCDWS